MYLAPSEFARRKFVAGGIPAERIVVKPNFVYPDPGVESHPGDYALFVGRLSEEKGLRILLSAWRRLRLPVPLLIAGEGPLRTELEEKSRPAGVAPVTFLGRLKPAEVLVAMRRARFLVFPSIWFENLPMTIIEAFACGVPVIASRIGALEEIVEDKKTGLHSAPGDAEDLATKVDWAWSHPDEIRQMGTAARAEYEAKYTADRNYEMLMRIYERAIHGAC
jgi:glycosyltransferase involved in cell wall biosynthesis